MVISENLEIEEIIEKHPETIGPMQEMGVQCMLCGEPVWGTLGERIRQKGLDSAKIIKRLNELVADSENSNGINSTE